MLPIETMKAQTKKYIKIIKNYILGNYRTNFREAVGRFPYPFFVPGASYSNELWDWDSWLMQIAFNEFSENTEDYEKGSVLNFFRFQDKEGRIPINVKSQSASIFDLVEGKEVNIHKPCLAQQAVLVSERYGDYSWLEEYYDGLVKFIDWYKNNSFHSESGLYFWINDFAIGVDNDPCVFYRPEKSTAAIFLNCLMYGELLAMNKIALALKKDNAERFIQSANELKDAINKQCWDERDGFYYSADVMLHPVDKNEWLHSGDPRAYQTLPMRIGVWAGFLAMYYGIATKEQADRMVKEHYLNEKTFYAPYGVRSLSKAERMYHVESTGNPSCWTGPVWINANYMTYVGLKTYGYTDLAVSLAERTIELLGRDIESCGQMHEYYHPETGEGVRGLGFQSWNLLVYNMCIDLEKDEE